MIFVLFSIVPKLCHVQPSKTKSNIIIIPIARKKQPLCSHIKVEMEPNGLIDGYYIIEHIHAISASRLGKKIGRVNKHAFPDFLSVLAKLCTAQNGCEHG